MTGPGHLAAAVLLAVLSAGGAGCAMPSSASYPLPRDVVWRAATSEAFSWQPTRIDDIHGVIYANQYDLQGRQFEIQIQVKDQSYFGRPSTRVEIFAQQSAPQIIRMSRLEQDYLARVRAALSAFMQPPASTQGENSAR